MTPYEHRSFDLKLTRSSTALVSGSAATMGAAVLGQMVATVKTAHVFRRYDLGNVEALRQRLTHARKKAATVTRLRGTAKQRATAAGDCTARACGGKRRRIKPAVISSGG
jgi:hypothetical protein